MSQTLLFENIDSPELYIRDSDNLTLADNPIQELIDTPLPEYNQYVDKIDTGRRSDLDTNYGKYWERQVVMSDGQKHTEILGLSTKTEADELAVSIPAWWTRLDGGLNKVTSDELLKSGKHTLIKGVSENQPSSLSRGAYDLHTVLSFDNNDGLGYYFDSQKIYVHGDSNGAMQGTGVIAYAPNFDREIIDAYLVDPCIPHKINCSDIKKALEHPTYVPKELLSLTRQIGRMMISSDLSLSEYSKSVENDPKRILGNLMLSKALFSGEFGSLLAHLPPEQNEHFVIFKHSLANQKQFFIKILESIGSKATVNIRTGTHASIADPRILADKISYLTKSSANA